MNCIAFLYKVRQSASPKEEYNPSIDIHANYWKLPVSNSEYNRFFDLGIKVYNSQDIESIFVYLPFVDASLKDRIEDLGKIVSSHEFASTFFNNDMGVHTFPNSPSYSYVLPVNKDSEQPFWIYAIDKSNIEVTKYPHGSLIEIKVLTRPEKMNIAPIDTNEGEIGQNNLYIRLRINNIKEGEFFTIESIKNDVFQSAFNNTEIINFHVNSIRELNSDDFQMLKTSASFLQVNKFHFFFVGSPQDEVVSIGSQKIECGLIDISKWEKYLKQSHSKKKTCMSYHWKYEQIQNPYHIFCRTIYRASNWCKIIEYILIVLVLGIFASYIANLIPSWQTEKTCAEQVNDSIQSQSPTDDRETTEG